MPARVRTSVHGTESCSRIEYGFDESTSTRKLSPSERPQLAIAAAADQDVFGLAVETRQLAEDVADVGADAEIVQFPGINRDAHALNHSPS